MNVAIITSGYLPVPPTKGGAVESIINNLINENEKYSKCDFVVYSIYDDCAAQFNSTKIKYLRTSKVAAVLDYLTYFLAKNILRRKHLISYRYVFQRMEFLRKVGKDISKNNYDRIVLENNVVMFKIFEYKNNFKKYRGKIYYHAHNKLGKTLGYDKYLKYTKKVIGVSDFITDYYRDLVSNIEYTTVHNCISEDKFTQELLPSEKNELVKDLKINPEWPVLLFTGRISEEKGVLELVNALANTKKSKYNLIIVGKSFFGTNIQDGFEHILQERTSKLKGNVVFTGLVPYDNMYKYYKLADLCILPSVWDEPCALTIIECIVAGTPLITTGTGGSCENINESTILVDVKNLEKELTNKIDWFLSNPKELVKLKERSSAFKFRFGGLKEYYNSFIKALDIK